MSATPPPIDPGHKAQPSARPEVRFIRSRHWLGFNPRAWQNWVIAVALLLGATAAIVFARAIGKENPEPGAIVFTTIGSIIGSVICIGAAPAGLLLIARFVKSPAAERALHSVAAVIALLIGGFMFVTFVAMPNRYHNRQELAASRREAAALTDQVFQEANALNKRFRELGALNPATMTTEPKLDERLMLLRDMVSVNADTLARIGTMRADIETIFDRHTVSTADRRAYWQRHAEATGGMESVLRLRELDRSLLHHMATYVTVLRDNHGHWSISDDGKVLFESEAALAAFNEASKAIADLSVEQNKLVRPAKNGTQTPAP